MNSFLMILVNAAKYVATSFCQNIRISLCLGLLTGLLYATAGMAESNSLELSSGSKSRSEVGFVGASARRISVNGELYPSAGFYLPNSFVNTEGQRWYAFLHGISRVRTRSARSGCEPNCSDAIAYGEFDLAKSAKQSLTLQSSLHSLTSRNSGTGFGEGLSLGFKYARALNNTTALSFSGEHIFQLDDTVDLGRNFFLGFSKFFSLSNHSLPGRGAVINAGLGSGLFAVNDNRVLSANSLFGGDNIAGAPDELTFGLVWSAAYFVSNRVSVGMEFSGFGFGAGVSFKPLRNYSLTSTLFLYDLIDDVPEGIPCAEDPCQPRLYGRLTHSF